MNLPIHLILCVANFLGKRFFLGKNLLPKNFATQSIIGLHCKTKCLSVYRESRMLESDDSISIRASDFASASTGCSTGSVCIAIATHDQETIIRKI